jgi:crotonobetainyl-CoA:carnitine CoA-transferase CaiB-like acyl-CoA transferase
VVLDNFSPRVMDSLGLGYTDLSALNPGVICISLSGFGYTGPHRDWVSYGPILEAHSGLAAATGYSDGGPMKLGAALPDGIGGLTGTFAILAALWEREETGVGVFIDVSQLEAYAAIAGEQVLATSLSGEPPARSGNRSAAYAPQGVYPCKGDDAWLALTVRSDEEWARLVAVTGSEPLRDERFRTVLGRMAEHDRIDALLAAWTRTRTKEAAMSLLQSAGLAATAVMTNADLVHDPHLAERGFMVEVDQADVGVRTFPGFPLHFSATPMTEFRGAPPLGGDNEAILTDVLGYPLDTVRCLEAQGVIGRNPPQP